MEMKIYEKQQNPFHDAGRAYRRRIRGAQLRRLFLRAFGECRRSDEAFRSADSPACIYACGNSGAYYRLPSDKHPDRRCRLGHSLRNARNPSRSTRDVCLPQKQVACAHPADTCKHVDTSAGPRKGLWRSDGARIYPHGRSRRDNLLRCARRNPGILHEKVSKQAEILSNRI